MKCFRSPLRTHCVNDVVLADLGYLGATGHVVVPHKKLPRQQLSEEEQRRNEVLGKCRARVEHFFSLLKNWALPRDGPQVRNPFLLRCLFTVAVLYEHHRMLSLHPRYPISIKEVLPGEPCGCTMRKRVREEEEEE
jgi:hypothetical protein